MLRHSQLLEAGQTLQILHFSQVIILQVQVGQVWAEIEILKARYLVVKQVEHG